MNKLKKLAVLSLLFSGKTLFSAEETAINVKRDHEQVTPEDRSEEPSLKKSRIKKSVVWKEELVEEFIIPVIRSEFFINGKQIDLPVCLEKKVFNGEALTEEEIALLLHEQVIPEDKSEEPIHKKSQIKKSVVWKEELVEEFTIPGIRSEFFIDGEQIDLPICLERKVFNGEPFTETEIALLSDYSSDEETEIETEEETEAE